MKCLSIVISSFQRIKIFILNWNIIEIEIEKF